MIKQLICILIASFFAIISQPAKAAISATNLAAAQNTCLSSSTTTVSVSPAANSLIIFTFVLSSSATAPTNAVSGLGLTWTEINSELGANRQISVWAAYGNATPGAITALITGTSGTCSYIIDQISGANGVSGVASAIPQSAVNNGSGISALSVSLSSLGLGSASYGATFYGSGGVGTITAGSGYSVVGSESTLAPTVQSQINLTGSTTVNWTYSGSNTPGGIGLEITLGAASGNVSLPMMGVGQ